MSNISISNAALDKIVEDTNSQTASGPRPIPRLLYYHRSYSTLNDGRIIEHGSGLTLSFVEPGEAKNDYYVPLYLDGGVILLIGPSAFFAAGRHEIDWVDRKFTLTSVKTDER